ncbi:MAG TPA: ATP-binding protein [Dehalococcoidia bacterium]|nr:ATP-binding protein [Dehalococcoidia bacterium]
MTAVDTKAAMAKARPWNSALEQLDAELSWLSLRLRVLVERGRRRRALGPPDSYRGLYVADEEVEHILSPDAEAAATGLASIVSQAAALRLELDARAKATVAAGAEFPLDRITRIFGLRPEERSVLLVALAASIDSAYEKVYAYANDDITRRRPTVEVALAVIADDPAAAVSLRPLFYADAPLVRHRLLSVSEESSPPSASLLTRRLEIDEHIAEVLLGAASALDPRLARVARSRPALGDDLEPELAQALGRLLSGHPQARVYLSGRWELEKEAATAAACQAAGLRLIVVDTPALRQADSPADLLALVVRDARLLHAGLLFANWDASGETEPEPGRLAVHLRPLIETHPLPVFFGGVSESPRSVPCEVQFQADVGHPSYAQRRREWQRAGAAPDDADQLAATFRLGAGEIRAAVRMARSIANARGAAEPSFDDLKAAARLQSQPRLTSLAQRIVPHFTWEDIVLPQDRLDQLREIAAQVLHQHVVYEEWGFGSKVSLGRGVTALFAGQSGTGKTMAAEIIAGELGLEMYKIDLSGLVSKYIGETEKNLARVFDEAGASNAILFFDEADAVFGKRTEVRDSHDRYANIEVSYLLQKMEEYDGIVVLATNLRSNLDEAFLRRMKAVVEFPFPEEDDRLRIWQRTLTSSAPVAEDVDLPFLARQFRIAGGNIKNIVLLAAFLAAERRQPIRMVHLIRAAKREFQKLGRLIAESDFGPWYEEARK